MRALPFFSSRELLPDLFDQSSLEVPLTRKKGQIKKATVAGTCWFWPFRRASADRFEDAPPSTLFRWSCAQRRQQCRAHRDRRACGAARLTTRSMPDALHDFSSPHQQPLGATLTTITITAALATDAFATAALAGAARSSTASRNWSCGQRRHGQQPSVVLSNVSTCSPPL